MPPPALGLNKTAKQTYPSANGNGGVLRECMVSDILRYASNCVLLTRSLNGPYLFDISFKYVFEPENTDELRNRMLLLHVEHNRIN